MESIRLIYRNQAVEFEYSPPSAPCKWSDTHEIVALARLTPAKERDIYRKLNLPKTMVMEHTHKVAQARHSITAIEAREAKERAETERKAEQQAASKAKSQALQRSAREAEEREREASFQRALAKRDALAAEAEAAAQAKAVEEEAWREAAPSQPRKRNYRQRQKHKQRQQLEAIEAKPLTMQLSITDAPPPPPESDPEDEKLCSICMEGEKTHACLPCGHRCLCAACAEPSLKLETCPICRVPVLMRARIFV